MEGDETIDHMIKPAVFVSNPLRLEGDALSLNDEQPPDGFLIHYGWRETLVGLVVAPERREFLIHYGWRETQLL